MSLTTSFPHNETRSLGSTNILFHTKTPSLPYCIPYSSSSDRYVLPASDSTNPGVLRNQPNQKGGATYLQIVSSQQSSAIDVQSQHISAHYPPTKDASSTCSSSTLLQSRMRQKKSMAFRRNIANGVRNKSIPPPPPR